MGVKEQLENINQLDDEIEKNEKNNSTTNLTKNINDLKEDLMNYIALNSLSGKDFCLNLTDKPLDIKKIQSEAENKFVKIKELVEKIEKNDLTKNLTEKLDELKENLKDYMVLNFPNIENCIKTGNDNARNNIQTIRSEVEEKFAYIKELGEEIEKNTPAYKLNEDSKELKRKLVEYIASDSLPVSDYLYKSNYNEYYYNQDKLYYEKTYYKILGIPYEEKFSTNKQRSKTIKKNYNKLCLICHPDKKIADNETLVKALRKIQGIYEWLEKYSNGWVPNHVA